MIGVADTCLFAHGFSFEAPLLIHSSHMEVNGLCRVEPQHP